MRLLKFNEDNRVERKRSIVFGSVSSRPINDCFQLFGFSQRCGKYPKADAPPLGKSHFRWISSPIVETGISTEDYALRFRKENVKIAALPLRATLIPLIYHKPPSLIWKVYHDDAIWRIDSLYSRFRTRRALIKRRELLIFITRQFVCVRLVTLSFFKSGDGIERETVKIYWVESHVMGMKISTTPIEPPQASCRRQMWRQSTREGQ